jgi:hypothetical protein
VQHQTNPAWSTCKAHLFFVPPAIALAHRPAPLKTHFLVRGPKGSGKNCRRVAVGRYQTWLELTGSQFEGMSDVLSNSDINGDGHLVEVVVAMKSPGMAGL